MQKKIHKIQENTPTIVNEPAVTYRQTVNATSSSDSWNPNVPFHGTQEEWREHFHRIEQGEFTSLEEANREFAEWKKEFLASRLM